MMRRVIAAVALAGIAGCQDYSFNPVGKCVIQPGSERITVQGLATADILFVIDDSGSMAAEQKRLADNFNAFISALAQTQAQRKGAGLDPLEFHIAITTSAIFEGWVATGSPVCGTPAANICQINTPGPPGQTPWTTAYTEACTQPGAACVDLITNYWTTGCPLQGNPYPAGNFVASGTNPKVLHFNKTLAWETWYSAWSPSWAYAVNDRVSNGGNVYSCIAAGTSANSGGPTGQAADITDGTAHWKFVGTAASLPIDPNITMLVTQFQQNINVGVCGSGMEQHLEGGRLAVSKALAGTQPGVAASEWPHPSAKMVAVFVGDEDDCSNPKDATMALAFTNAASSPGNDVCTQDDAKPVAQRKKFPVQDYVDYFTGLGRPFSGAFIYSADPTSCTPDASGNIVCTPGLCSCQCPPSCASCGPSASGACQIASDCSGKASGNRFHDTSAGLRAKGVQTLDGSVCDWNFGKTLQGIAELVKPPAGLTLPTPPAAGQVTTLLIESADGKSSRTCNGPGTNLDWYFVDCKTNAPLTAGTSTCILINHDTGNCEPNPGETYVAQYLGLVPTPSLSNPSGGCAAVSDCVTALGGEAQDWSCTASGSTRGTCLCATP